MVENSAIEALVKAIQQDPVDTNNKYSAVVSRVDNEGIIWVHLAGSTKETPTASTSAEVRAGDSVMVEWRNNKLYIAGNYSNPSAGSIRVDQVEIAAGIAQEAATSAVQDAGIAREAASEAVATADSVRGIAADAQTSADSAQASAQSAMKGLSYVEDVVNVVTWIATHGEYSKATGTFDATKTYFTLEATAVDTPTAEDIGTYYELVCGKYIKTSDTAIVSGKTYYTAVGTPVAEPKADDFGTYYELEMSDAVANYINTHLALTDEGLYVLSEKNGWRVLIKNDGVYIVNPDGVIVSRYKDEIILGDMDETTYVQQAYNSLSMIDIDNAKIYNAPTFSTDESYDVGDYVVYDGAYYQCIQATTGEWDSSVWEQVHPWKFLQIIDERDSSGETGCSEHFDVTSSTQFFDLEYKPSQVVSLTIDGIERTDYTIMLNPRGSGRYCVMFDEAIEAGSVLDVVYKTKDNGFKSFTFGRRDPDGSLGQYSTSFGMLNIASGRDAFAHGYGSKAINDNSFVSGYLAVAIGQNSEAFGHSVRNEVSNSCVVGHFNKTNVNAVFSVGNAWSESLRSNAFEVYQNGDLTMYLDTNAASGTDYNIYTALQTLGWTNCII